MKVVSNEQMNRLDHDTIHAYKVPGLLLMERASLEVFYVCQKLIKQHDLNEVVIFVGPGNNGGDGLAVARHLEAEGLDVKVVVLAPPDALSGDALANYHMLLTRKVPIIEKMDQLTASLTSAMNKRLVIDAIFGTGIRRQVEGTYLRAVQWINEQKSVVLSIDIPSGVHGDTGQVLGEAVIATSTVTFQLPKVGNVCYPGAGYHGKLEVVSIGIPQELIDQQEMTASLPSAELMAKWLPKRPLTAHKGTCGSLLIIGGIEGYSGAGVLTARGAQRCGVGLIKTAVRKSVNQVYEHLLPEVVTLPMEESVTISADEPSRLSEKGMKDIAKLADQSDAVVAGPGWGLGADWFTVLKELVHMEKKPLLLDADALNLISSHLDWLKQRSLPAVLTPHPGEMSRLTGLSVEEINNNRLQVTARAAREWNAVVLLKGAGTVVAAPNGEVMVNTTGNPGMATAGSGDVLAGIIGALLAQGLAPFQAAVLGCWLHGAAGDVAAKEAGEISLMVSDIINGIPEAIGQLLELKQVQKIYEKPVL